MTDTILTDEARDALVQAALAGVEQCFGVSRRDSARCAMGVIAETLSGCVGWNQMHPRVCVPGPLVECPAESEDGVPCQRMFLRSAALLVHLNDRHRWDFLTIARKLGA